MMTAKSQAALEWSCGLLRVSGNGRGSARVDGFHKIQAGKDSRRGLRRRTVAGTSEVPTAVSHVAVQL